MSVPKPARTRAFISYSHKDERYLDRLHVHIGPFVRENKIDVWDDTRIKLGADWRKEISDAINSAKVAILLVSADFLNSEFIATNELPQLLEAAEQEGLLIFSVILGPSIFRQTVLARYQTLNTPSKPLINMPKPRREEAWQRLAEYINAALSDQKIESPSIMDPLITYPTPDAKARSGQSELTSSFSSTLLPINKRQNASGDDWLSTPRLIISQGSQPGRSYSLHKDKIKIGRSRESEVFLDDPAIAHFHAYISFDKMGYYYLHNRWITHITKVNDHRVLSKHRLQEGDQIQIGQTTLIFVARGSTANRREVDLISQQPKNLYPQENYSPKQITNKEYRGLRTQPYRAREEQPVKLIVIQGKEPHRVYKFYKNEISIGRNEESDIFLDDANISRKHATIYQTQNNEYWIRDEESTNGTMINGYRRSACLLQDGDDIELGEAILRFFRS